MSGFHSAAWCLAVGGQRMCAPAGFPGQYHQLQITFVFPFPVLKRWLFETPRCFQHVSDAYFQLCKCSEDILCLGLKPLPLGTNPRQEFLTRFLLSRPAAPHCLWVVLPTGGSRDAPCRPLKWLEPWLWTNCIKSNTALWWPKWPRWILLPFTVLINSESPLISSGLFEFRETYTVHIAPHPH